ncbi:acyl-[acyl-carrier-protein] thioesterase [Treponema sp. R6D11]
MNEYIIEHRVSEFMDCNSERLMRLAPLWDVMQECAEQHLCSLGMGHEKMLENGNFWVIAREAVDVVSYPAAGDVIKIRTFSAGVDKFIALRNWEVYNSENARIVLSKSSSMLIDATTGRPLRCINAYPDYDWEEPMNEAPNKIIFTEECEKFSEFTVQYSDIDSNNHVNNARYINWVENVLGYSPKRINVNYIAETKLGDFISVYYKDNKIKFSRDGKTVFLAEIS